MPPNPEESLLISECSENHWNSLLDKSIDEILKNLNQIEELNGPVKTCHWIQIVLKENVWNGKRKRALGFVLLCQSLINNYESASPEKVCILAWCLEMLQASSLISDDIMDGGQYRRGEPCWYLRDNVGLNAITDSLLLNDICFQLLKIHFEEKNYFMDLVLDVQRTIFKTNVGQALDAKAGAEKLYTNEIYEQVVKYKTSTVISFLPAFILAGKYNQEVVQSITKISEKIGKYLQLANDFIDLYPQKQTKTCFSDIIEGKCTWFIVHALKNCTEEQRESLMENYGNRVKSKELVISKVMEIFDDMGLKQAFYEEANRIQEDILKFMNAELSKYGIPHTAFNWILEHWCTTYAKETSSKNNGKC